jgi:hypothetical protein
MAFTMNFNDSANNDLINNLQLARSVKTGKSVKRHEVVDDLLKRGGEDKKTLSELAEYNKSLTQQK